MTTGTPPFRSFSGGPDIINLGNLNVHYSIPIFSRPGRGIPFKYSLAYDSSVWKLVGTSWLPASSSWGLNRELSASVGTMTMTSRQVPGCSGTGATIYTFANYVDATGTGHKMFATVSDDSDCPNYSVTRVLDDSSGLTITVDATPSATVTWADGRTMRPTLSSGTNSGAGTSTDENGNQITSVVNGSTTTFYDTLSTTTRALTISGIAPADVTYKYTSPSGADAVTTAHYKAYTVQTWFQCSGIQEYGRISNSLIDTITLPDQSQYKFTYEPTPAGASCTPLTGTTSCVTGRIASVTLPTSGKISYAYTGNNDGVMCSDGSTAGYKRTTPDTTSGTQWKYVRDASAGTTKLTDPQNNETVITFNGEFETLRDVYSGSSNSGTLLEEVTTCYNGTPSSPCGGSVVTPFSQVTMQRSFDGGLQSRVDTQYDGYGSVTELDEYDFGASSATRKTTTVYAILGNNNNIVDRPSSVTVKDANGTQKARTEYFYDEYALQGTGTLPNHTNPPSGTPRGNLTTVKRYTSATTTLNQTLKYYDTGLVYTSTDVNTTATTTYTYGYCASAFPSIVNLPLSLSRSMIWNCTGGVPTSISDENSKASTYTYDDPYYWRPHKVGYADGGETSYTYHTGSAPPLWSVDSTTKIDSTHNLTGTTTLDALGRVTKSQVTSAPEGTITTTTLFDVNGRVASRTNPQLSTSSPTDGTTSYIYDALGRVTTVTHPDTSAVSTTYYRGATKVQDEGNGTARVTKVYQADGLGRLASVCEVTSATLLGISGTPSACNQDQPATGFLTSYTYDTLNNLTQVIQGGLNSRQYSYDQLSRITSETTPESGNTTYTYDTVTKGDLYQRVAPKPNQTLSATVTTTYTFDGLHRLTQKSYNDGTTSTVKFAYDQTSAFGFTSLPNPKGRMTSAWTVSGSTTLAAQIFKYDAVGRVSDNSQCVASLCNSASTFFAMPYTYNFLGEPLTFPSGGGFSYAYTYDLAGRPSSLTSGLAYDGNHPASLLSGISFNPLGEMTHDTLGSGTANNGISESRTYDSRGRLTSAFSDVISGPGIYHLTNIGYTPNGNLAGATDSILGGTWNYTYDDFNRLLTTTQTSGVACDYKYDRFGNRLQQNGSTCPVKPQYTFDSASHITPTNCGSITAYCYDAAGNMTQDTFHQYQFDAEGKIKTVDASGTPTNYVYDALGRRVQWTTGSTTTYFVVDLAGRTVTESQGGTYTRFEVYTGGHHLVTYRNALTYFDFQDLVGTERVKVTQNAASSESCSSLSFGDNKGCWGAANGQTGPTFFTGQDRDSESNLDHFWARSYSSTQGRWVVPDPGGIAVSSVGDPQTWNRYAYVINNPVLFADPFGLEPGVIVEGPFPQPTMPRIPSGFEYNNNIRPAPRRDLCDAGCWKKLLEKALEDAQRAKGCGAQRIALAAKGLVSVGIGIAKVGIAAGSVALLPETGGATAVGVAYGTVGAAGNFTAGGVQLAGAISGKVNVASDAADVASTVTTVGGSGALLITRDREKASLSAGAESLFTAGYNGGATGHLIDEAANALQTALLSTELGETVLDALGLSGTGGCPH
ncbi:MAG TPA: RHS repeat-associated core domain-containing protein [Terriglobales bacterium]|nr:RHS repeat-associated core domain-containing protein [Terriglobales bacterium]